MSVWRVGPLLNPVSCRSLMIRAVGLSSRLPVVLSSCRLVVLLSRYGPSVRVYDNCPVVRWLRSHVVPLCRSPIVPLSRSPVVPPRQRAMQLADRVVVRS